MEVMRMVLANSNSATVSIPTQTQQLQFYEISNFIEESTVAQDSYVVKLITNAIKWMTKDKSTYKVGTNLDSLDEKIATYVNDITGALEDPSLDVFIVTKYTDWSQDLVEKLKQFMENGGSVIFAIGNSPGQLRADENDLYPLKL